MSLSDSDNSCPSLPPPLEDASDSSPHPKDTDSFTAEEVANFRKRYDEGYDICTDKRYNSWLQTFGCKVLEPQTTIAPFLTLPEAKYPDCSSHKCTARVITSVEFRKNLEEKKKKKLLEVKQKEEREQK